MTLQHDNAITIIVKPEMSHEETVAYLKRYLKRCARLREKYELDFREKKKAVTRKDRNKFMRMVLQTRKYERRHIAYVFNIHRSTLEKASLKIHIKFFQLLNQGHPIEKIAPYMCLSLSTAKMLRDKPLFDMTGLPPLKTRIRIEARKPRPPKPPRKPPFTIIRICPDHLDGCPSDCKNP